MNRLKVAAVAAFATVLLYGCASAVSSGYGRGGQNVDGRSYEAARADNRITAAVTSLLVRDKTVPAMDIDVTTLNGIVTLRGRVPSAEVSRRAEALAASVPGVSRIDNRMQVPR